MLRDVSTQTYKQDPEITEISSKISITCEDCKESKAAKYFHRYAHKKTGEFIRAKRCNECCKTRPKCFKPRKIKESKLENE